MKLLSILLIGMFLLVACGNEVSETSNAETTDTAADSGNQEVIVDNSETVVDTPETGGGAIDESIIGDDSSIDTEGVDEILNDW